MDDAWFREKLEELDLASLAGERAYPRVVSEVVPTYHYREEEAQLGTPVG